MAQDDYPVDDGRAKYAQRVERALVLMLLNLVEDFLLPAHDCGRITEVYELCGEVLAVRQELKLGSLVITLVFFLIKQTKQEVLVDLHSIHAIVQCHVRLVVVQSVELFDELIVTTILRKLSERQFLAVRLALAVSQEQERVEALVEPHEVGQVEERTLGDELLVLLVEGDALLDTTNLIFEALRTQRQKRVLLLQVLNYVSAAETFFNEPSQGLLADL